MGVKDGTITIEPEQSASQIASQVGSDFVLLPTQQSTFATPTSRASSSVLAALSPTRVTPIVLKNASLRVLTESHNSTETPRPVNLQQLGDNLVTDVDWRRSSL